MEIRGDRRGALSAFRRARVAASRAGDRALESRVYAATARVWLAQGDVRRARRNLSRALLLDPSNAEAEEAARRL